MIGGVKFILDFSRSQTKTTAIDVNALARVIGNNVQSLEVFDIKFELAKPVFYFYFSPPNLKDLELVRQGRRIIYEMRQDNKIYLHTVNHVGRLMCVLLSVCEERFFMEEFLAINFFSPTWGIEEIRAACSNCRNNDDFGGKDFFL